MRVALVLLTLIGWGCISFYSDPPGTIVYECETCSLECSVIGELAGSPHIRREHCIDSGPGFEYEYDLYSFSTPSGTYVARSYSSSPNEAHFLRRESSGEVFLIAERDFHNVHFQAAASYLRRQGFTRLEYLSREPEAYSPVPLPPTQEP